MTAAEIGAALGPEWTADGVVPLAWSRSDPGAKVEQVGTKSTLWWAEADAIGGIVCGDPEGAVAVAHLLVAAARVAAGATVAEHSVYMAHSSHDGADRRRLALDLLRAADAAEAQT